LIVRRRNSVGNVRPRRRSNLKGATGKADYIWNNYRWGFRPALRNYQASPHRSRLLILAFGKNRAKIVGSIQRAGQLWEKLSKRPISVSQLAEPLYITLAAVIQHLQC
jgi:hypothetical protein